MSKSIFDQFTNLYEFSKTLSFSLIPMRWDGDKKPLREDWNFGALKEKGFIEKDERIAANIKIAKFYLDILHREHIQEILQNLHLNREDLQNLYELSNQKASIKISKNDSESEKAKKKKEKDEIQKKLNATKEALLNSIKDAIAEQNNKLRDKYNVGNDKPDSNILLSQHALTVLRQKFNKETVEELRRNNIRSEIEYPDVTYINEDGKECSVFDMGAGYLDEFHKNRRLLYSATGKKGSLGRRILDNFDLFCKNKFIFDDTYSKSDIDFTKVENALDVFQFSYYNNNERDRNCITQSGIDAYNKIIGDLNQIINLHKQKKVSELRQNDNKKPKKYPFFERLQKQILSEVFKKQILIDDDESLIREARHFINEGQQKIKDAADIAKMFVECEKNLQLSQIYLSKGKINTFAQRVFEKPDKFREIFSDSDVASLSDIKSYLESNDLAYRDSFKPFAKNKQPFEAFLTAWWQEFNVLIDGDRTAVRDGKRLNIKSLKSKQHELEASLSLLEEKTKKQEKLSDDEENRLRATILAYTQTVLDITKRAEIFRLNEKQAKRITAEDKDPTFYTVFEAFTNQDFVPSFYLDAFRNYLSRRSAATKKDFKLHFNNDDLLKGWDINKESDYRGFLLRKRCDDSEYFEYYLGVGIGKNIFHHKKGKEVDEVEEAYKIEDDSDFYEKIEYKQLDISRFDGIAFPKAGNNIDDALKRIANEFLDGKIEELKRLWNIKKEYDAFKEKNKDNPDHVFDKQKLTDLLGYYITCLRKRDDWSRFRLQFKPPEEYHDREDFNDHLQRQSYWMEPKRINSKYIKEKVGSGELILFKIHTQDFFNFKSKVENEKSENLFTRYFLELFSNENFEAISSKDPDRSIFKLDGDAELRFRPKIDEMRQKPVKKNGEIVIFKDWRDGKTKQALKHYRFTKDSITLHLKTKFNFGKPTINIHDFNLKINQQLLAKLPVKILAFDRGENNLLYYYILGEDGTLEGSGSLNKIGLRERKLEDGTVIKEPIDYLDALIKREGERDWARKNVQEIKPIKPLKKAYLAAVKGWISEVITKNLSEGYATLIVLEDLGDNFKKSRFFRERQIYQNFEKELIDKLNYLVNKKQKNYRNAYQFTPLIKSVEEMEEHKQIGIVCYVPAAHTSKICPKCGMIKRFSPKNYSKKNQIVDLLKKGIQLQSGGQTKGHALYISYQAEQDRFCFTYQWEQKYKENGKNQLYTGIDQIFSNVSRKWWDSSKRTTATFEDNTPTSLTSKLKELFSQEDIDYHQDINKQLIDKQKTLKLESFLRPLIFYFNLILQIRNYDKSTQDALDYIQCPSCLFDTRKSESSDNSTILQTIKDGDANGAYNIARKGIMLLRAIRSNPEDPHLFINNRQWDEAARDWNGYLMRG